MLPVRQQVPWTRQPQYPVGIDWSNPLARELRFAYAPTLGKDVGRFGRLRETNIGVSRSAGAYGIGESWSATANAGARFGNFPVIDSSAAFTYLSIAAPTAEAKRKTLLAYQYGYASPYSTIQLIANFSPSAGAVASGTLVFMIYDSGYIMQVERASVIDGRPHVYAAVRDTAASRKDIFLDGALLPKDMNSDLASSFSYSTMEVSVGNDAGYAATDRVMTEPIWLSVIWNRALSDDEIRRVSANPWQLFAPANSPRFISLGVAGSSEISGTLSTTLGALTSSATGTVLVAGALASTLDAVTAAATGTVAVSGAATITLGGATVNAAGAVVAGISGAAAITLDAATASATGAVAVAGALTQTLDALSAQATGTVLITGAATQTLDALSLSATGSIGTVAVTGSAAITLDALTQTASGVVPVVGAASVTLDAVQAQATGTVAVTGSAAVTLDALSAQAEGIVGFVPVVGAASITLGGMTSAATGRVDIIGSLGVGLDDVITVASGSVAIRGQATITLGALTMDASDAGVVRGAASIDLADLTAVGYAMQTGLSVEIPQTRRIGDRSTVAAAERIGPRTTTFKRPRIGPRIARD